MMLHDYHMHSNFSCDCKATMAEMCHSAIAKGIPEIGFTEHYDLHPNEGCRDWFKLDEWAAELEKCRVELDGRLIIRAGIEIGEPHIFGTETQAMLKRYPFDYVLGSLHWVGAETIFDPDYFRRRTQHEAFAGYFVELERLTRIGEFDILSHFDVLIRAWGEMGGQYDPLEYEDAIRPVLRNCVERGIALDINTKGLRSKINMLTPNVDILRWYVETGGERATLGSDSHQPYNVGADLDKAASAARAAGIKWLTRFEGRESTLIRID